MKLSVIIPVYNVEKYLNECMESVCNQTYKNIEIILVDDGSTDSSGRICDLYANCDKRISVIHQANGGLSNARNTGIKVATGDYICFIDSDDFLMKLNLFEKIVSRINVSHPDVLNLNYSKCFPNGDKKIVLSNLNMDFSCNFNDNFKFLMNNNLFVTAAWNKIIKRSYLINNNLYFVENILSEDVDWCSRILVTAESLDYLGLNYYGYRQRNNSISHTVSFNHLITLSESVDFCIDNAKYISKDLVSCYYSYVAYQYGTLLYHTIKFKERNKVKKLEVKLEKNKILLKFGKSNKIRMLYFFEKIIGFKGLLFVLEFLNKIGVFK